MGCAQGLQDPHAKVRWAACQAVGQLCTDLGPELQEAEHARLLPGLMAVMDDFGAAARAGARRGRARQLLRELRAGARCVRCGLVMCLPECLRLCLEITVNPCSPET